MEILPTSGKALDAEVERAVAACYQCGKCSAGCPMAEAMDLLPNRLLRLVQLGRIDKAAAAEAPWLCVSCQTCTTRCPQSVDCAAVLDALRQIAVGRGLVPRRQQRTLLFQQAFLESIRRYGRVHEVELIGRFKTRALLGDLNVPLFFKDALLAPRLYRRGKLHLTGETVRDRDLVARIFARCRAEPETT